MSIFFMLDAFSLDQLRAFIAAAEEGNFSAAGRRLLRAQSVVSQTISSFESLLGVGLFDRTKRYPQLTAAGQSLLFDAKAIIAQVDAFKARARGMSTGLEPELSVAVDVMFPMSSITQTARAFAATFPAVPLRIHIEALGGAIQPVLDGRCALAIIGSWPDTPDNIQTERLLGMLMVMVAAPHHPLARIRAPIPRGEVSKHAQLVLTDRTPLTEGRTFGVMSSNFWKLTDLRAKHEFLLDGLGWGAMPMATIAADLAANRLVIIHIEDEPPNGMILPMSIAYLKATPPGPAGRWFIDTLLACSRIHDAADR